MAEVVNKPQLVEAVKERLEEAFDRKVTKVEGNTIVEAVFSSISDNLSKGETVRLTGFGTFEVRERAARKGRNPQTGEEIDIPATKAVHFKAGKGLKEAVK